MQTLTYVIGKDKRALVKNLQNFKVDFNTATQDNWVQARQGERGLRQVFVNILNEDGSPYNLTGSNIWFEGVLPDKVHRVLDAKHGVMLDAQNGRFRFDMPGPAFAVAGSYVQAFFRIMKDGNSLATLEFDLEVLADLVLTDLVPRDYITPLEQVLDEGQASVDAHSKELDRIITDLKQNYETDISNLRTSITKMSATAGEIQSKLDSENIVTEKEFTDGMASSRESITSQVRTIVSNIGNASPKGVYSTLAELQSDYPKGTTGIYLTHDNGHWYYFDDGSWRDGGKYSAESFADDSVKSSNLTPLARLGMVIGGKNATFDIDLENRKMTWENFQVTAGNSQTFFSPGSAAITTDPKSGGFIMADMQAKILWTLAPNSGDESARAEQSAMIGVIYADGRVWVNTNKFYSAGHNDQFSNRSIVGAHSRAGWLEALSNTTADITKNSDGKLVLTFSGGYLVLMGQKMRFVTTPQQWDLTNLLGVGGYIVLNNSDLSIKGVTRGDEASITDQTVIIGAAWGDGSAKLFTNMTQTVNNYTSWYQNEINSRFATLILGKHQYFDVDTTKTPWQLVPPDYFQVMLGDFYGQTIKEMAPVDLPMDGESNQFGGVIVIDRDNQKIRGIHMGDRITTRESPIGYVYVDGSVWINGSQTTAAAEKLVPNSIVPADGQMKILNLGDSITQGWDGLKTVTTNWAQYVAHKLDMLDDDAGVGGATIMEQDNGKTFDAQLATDRDFSSYDIITVMFGVNDYSLSNHGLDDIKAKLTSQLTDLKGKVTHGKLYGILPLPSYRTPLPNFWTEQPAQTSKNAYGYDMNGLMDLLKSVYASFNMPVLDWRDHQFITNDNYHYWLPNDGLHPSQKGYIRMGQIITEFIRSN